MKSQCPQSYRASKFSIPIKECYYRSLKFFAAHTILFSVENLLFNVPMLLPNRENRHMDNWSGRDKDILSALDTALDKHLICFIINLVATPLMMGALTYFYFVKKGHPWVRILRRELQDTENLS